MTGPRFNPDLLKVPLYIAGRSVDEVREELGLERITKMASNESPIGPSPMATEAARRTLAEAHRYPGMSEGRLHRKLAEMNGGDLDETNFLVGNGGTDVLRMVIQSFVFDGGNTVMGRATFPMYHILTTMHGGEPRRTPPRPDCSQDLEAMLASIDDDTRLVFLCSPNNPTGQVIKQAEVDYFMSRVPEHVVVVFDESYKDFATDPNYADSLALVRRGRNTLIVRSFSKTAGLANLRIGYLIGPQKLVDYVRHARLPFHTGDLSLAAAAASLEDGDYHERNRRAVIEGRAYLHSSVTGMGLNCLPSQANFVTLLDPPLPPKDLAGRLLLKGFIVRDMGAFGLPNGVRVSVGSAEDNERFIEALKEVLDGG